MNEEFDFSTFDATSVDTSFQGDSQPVPAGTYEAMITSSEMRKTKSGNGSYLALGFQILNGPCARRLVFANINLVNPSEKAREIGRRELAKIMQAVGRPRVQSHTELRSIPLLIKVAVRNDPGYQPSNEVKDYAPLSAQPAPVQAPPAPAPVVAPPAPTTIGGVIPPTPAPAASVPWA